MKAIMISIKPKWVAKILNKEKTIEVRKLFPKDYAGWVYLYCTKEDSLCCIKRIDRDRYICGKDFDLRDFPHLSSGYDGKGKVVARFWCDKVEEYVNGLNWEYVQHDAASYDDYESILEPSCLTDDELSNYVEDLSFFAIHISKLEIFDESRELSEFRHWVSYKKCKKCSFEKYYGRNPCLEIETITKAPQSWCYVEIGK